MSFRGGRLRDFSMPVGTVWLLTDSAEAKGRQTLYTQQSPQVSKPYGRRLWYRVWNRLTVSRGSSSNQHGSGLLCSATHRLAIARRRRSRGIGVLST